jgi:hypothetical protein
MAICTRWSFPTRWRILLLLIHPLRVNNYQQNQITMAQMTNDTKDFMLISIGAWCRASFQVNEFLRVCGKPPVSYPFDWTITPFASLQNTLRKGFDPQNALHDNNLISNKFGSLSDNITQLIHHHDFNPTAMKGLPQSELNHHGVPLSVFHSDLVTKARGRFLHTYANLESSKNSNKKLMFVRWNSTGHPDTQVPDAYEGETLASLAEIISGYLDHDNFSILRVTSKFVQEQPTKDTAIIDYERKIHGVSATIIERKGYNGDGTNSFKGETVSWHTLLTKFVNEEVN